MTENMAYLCYTTQTHTHKHAHTPPHTEDKVQLGRPVCDFLQVTEQVVPGESRPALSDPGALAALLSLWLLSPASEVLKL